MENNGTNQPYSIATMLQELPDRSSSPCIYKVPNSLRRANTESFTPRLVAIGPFHHDNPRLKPTEDLKLRYYRNFLNRDPYSEFKGEHIPMYIGGREQVIRSHYQEEIRIDSDEFCRMILLDAVFIIELLLKKEEGDAVFENRWWFSDLLNDMLLIENQIPLFIVKGIYYYFYLPDNQIDFAYLVRNFLRDVKDVPYNLPLDPSDYDTEWGQRHFVEYLLAAHVAIEEPIPPTPEDPIPLNPENPVALNPENPMTLNPENPSPSNFGNPLQTNTGNPSLRNPEDPSSSNPENLSPSNHETISPSNPGNPSPSDPGNPFRLIPENASLSNHEIPPPLNLIPSLPWKFNASTVSKLFECGVKFRRGVATTHIDINFNPTEGILTIPRVKVNEWTDTMFRNFVAFEQCHHVVPRYASDYLIFMDGLIDTPEDVKILTDAGIIQDDLQNLEKVSDIFNNLHKEVITEGRDYFFAEQSRMLNDYRRDLWHRFKAWWYKSKLSLKRDYFNSPWSSISLFAASILVGLTFIQTICSIYQAKGIKM